MALSYITDRILVCSIDELQNNRVSWMTSSEHTVLSVCQDTAWENVSDDVRQEHVALADDPQSVERWGGSCSYETFCKAADKAVSALDVGELVIHCHHGKNRSVSVAAASLAVHNDVKFHRALTAVLDHRAVADPNDLMLSHAARYVRDNR
jgi:predicted protein tyrosine phosphatase